MTDRPFLSVVIPAYNESDNLKAGALTKVAQYFATQSYSHEVLIVDDGSQGDTAALAEAFAQAAPRFRVLRAPHRGKAQAVAAGLLAACGEIVLFSDMDQATPIGETVWRNAILGFSGVTDTQCGFKAFRGVVVRPLVAGLRVYTPMDGSGLKGASVTSGFDVELLCVARRLGCRAREVPVEWDYRRTRRVNLLRDSWRGLRDLLRIRLADLRGVYGRELLAR